MGGWGYIGTGQKILDIKSAPLTKGKSKEKGQQLFRVDLKKMEGCPPRERKIPTRTLSEESSTWELGEMEDRE